MDYLCKHDCSTCEFCMPHKNHFVCAGTDEYYGTSIDDIPDSKFPCDGWGISYEEYCNQINLGVVEI